MAERGPTPMLHCVLQHILTVCISCAHCFAVCPCLRSCSSCHGIIDLGFPPFGHTELGIAVYIGPKTACMTCKSDEKVEHCANQYLQSVMLRPELHDRTQA